MPFGTIDLGSFEVLSDHGDTAEDVVDVDNPRKNPLELCHRCHLLLGSRRQRLQSMQGCIAGGFGNLAMETAETKSLHSSIATDKECFRCGCITEIRVADFIVLLIHLFAVCVSEIW